jgi:uncharacterized damage-inducible protein DinB
MVTDNTTPEKRSMNKIVSDLQAIIRDFSGRFEALDEEMFSAKPLPNKWSKKEILGHLVDSAHNNLRRFICSQYETESPTIIYDQDFWVRANGYQQTSKHDIIVLWALLNERICAVLSCMPADQYQARCNTGKEKRTEHTLLWLAEDYVKHMKHHLSQIIPGSFDVIYP